MSAWVFLIFETLNSPDLNYYILIAITYPIVAVGLWLSERWGFVLCFLSMALDANLLIRNYSVSNLLELFMYSLIFVTFCVYKLIKTYLVLHKQ